MSADSLWYKDAVIYQLHVKAFRDSTGDGIGDFTGLGHKLDYIRDLGVTAVWLLPFYPSPLRDDGYDISNYRNVNPAYGTVRDLRRFVERAHALGIRVITELVINHTSDQHPWFQRARRAKPGSSLRNFYVWRDTDTAYRGTRIIFTETEKSNWAWDPVANAYYWHRFFSHQPDLNFDNPRVSKEVMRAMEFWLDMGIDGLRLDAVPYLCERDGTTNENLPETHAVIKKMRAAFDTRYSDRMLLAEANQWPEDVRHYFGDGDECHMAFHFPLMPRIFMAVAQEDRHPITDILRQTPDIPEKCQWAIFLRNHDELTLEMVTDRERDYLWKFYATDPRMRLNIGIRRRLAPLLDNDRRKIELLNSLLMSMPGTPVIYYGDEIGMGDNIFLGDRDGVRTPMQWSPDRNAGFSGADPPRVYLPPVMDPVYGYEAVNVEAQSRSPSSLLNWMKRLIAVRKAHLAFGRGKLTLLYPGNRKVFAYLREYGSETILCLANLSRAPQPVELGLAAFKGRVPVELLGRTAFPPVADLPYFITLPSYGFYWFLLAEKAVAPSWHETQAPPVPELHTLVVPETWKSLAAGAAQATLHQRILPEYLSNQRWYGAKGTAPESVETAIRLQITENELEWQVSTYRTRLADGGTQTYLLPLGIAWENGPDDPLVRLLPYTLARVRRGSKLGVLYDALADETFVRTLLRRIRDNATIDMGGGTQLAFRTTERMAQARGSIDQPIQRVGREQSNTSLKVGDTIMFKLYRRIAAGIHPEVEMTRFLTEVARFPNTPPLLGAIEVVDSAGHPTALGVAHAQIRNQGDGWTYTLDYLKRFLEEAALHPETLVQPGSDPHAVYVTLARTLGTRTAELHRALASDHGNPAFRPEPTGPRDLAAWRRRVDADARAAIVALKHVRNSLPKTAAEPAERLLGLKKQALERLANLVPENTTAMRTRFHGDLHLGQVIVVQNDFHIIDFEGEPARPLSERRYKSSPLRDVAGMLRSFSYAAWSALLDNAKIRVDSFDALLPRVQDWEARSAAAFLGGYREAIGDCPSYPSDPAEAERLTQLFTLEKAFYEISYEAANRPGWLHIPVLGVLRLINGGS